MQNEKEQCAEHCAELVAWWLREIAINNLGDERLWRFVDVVEDLRTRAIFGFKQYVIDTEEKRAAEEQKIIRCKNCKHSGLDNRDKLWCSARCEIVTDDWFCADGERRDDNA